jgi:hypothetical protein
MKFNTRVKNCMFSIFPKYSNLSFLKTHIKNLTLESGKRYEHLLYENKSKHKLMFYV